MQSLFFYYYFFGDKKQLLKAVLTCAFILSLLNSFSFAQLDFKIKEKVHIKAIMLLVCLEVLEEGIFCFPGRDCEGFVGNYCL